MKRLKEKFKKLVEKNGKKKVYTGVSISALLILLLIGGCAWGFTSTQDTNVVKEDKTEKVSSKSSSEKDDEDTKSEDESKEEDSSDDSQTNSSTTNTAKSNTGKKATTETKSSKSSSNSRSNSSSNSNSGSNNSSGSNSGSTHTHNWVYHEAVTKWVVDVPYQSAQYEQHTICSGCGIDFTALGWTQEDVDAHGKEHTLNGVSGGSHTAMVEVSPEIPEQGHTEVVQEAYYSCSCGLTK